MTSPMPPGQTSLLLQMTQRLALSDAHFRRICQLIYQRAGIVLADHKRDMVYNRLVRRLRTLGLDDFGRYLSMLEANQNSAEWQAFINSLTTNLTAFFREAHHFPVLAEHARRRTGEYRVWSAAASTGEEPYSLAIFFTSVKSGRTLIGPSPSGEGSNRNPGYTVSPRYRTAKPKISVAFPGPRTARASLSVRSPNSRLICFTTLIVA